MKNHMTFEVVVGQVRELVGDMKSVKGFKVADHLKSGVKKMAEHIELGKTHLALDAGLEVLEAGRSILGAFLRFSVIDRNSENSPTRTAFFTREIAKRRDEEKFDQDLVARLEKFRKELEAAVRAETNGTFNARITAYNAMMQELEKTDAEQERRDRVRSVRAAEERKAAKQRADAEATERNKAAAENQRQKMLAARRQQAEELRSLI